MKKLLVALLSFFALAASAQKLQVSTLVAVYERPQMGYYYNTIGFSNNYGWIWGKGDDTVHMVSQSDHAYMIRRYAKNNKQVQLFYDTPDSTEARAWEDSLQAAGFVKFKDYVSGADHLRHFRKKETVVVAATDTTTGKSTLFFHTLTASSGKSQPARNYRRRLPGSSTYRP